MSAPRMKKRRAADLDVGYGEPPLPLDDQLQHGHPVVRGSARLAQLEGRDLIGHEVEPVERQRVDQVLGQQQVAEVHGIKRPPEDPDGLRTVHPPT